MACPARSRQDLHWAGRHPPPARRKHSRSQYGQGVARDGLLGPRGRAPAAATVADAWRNERSRADGHFTRYPDRPGAASRALLAVAAVAAGYRKIKLKIQPSQDLDYVRAVRKALGDDVEIMADANAAYTIADAKHLAQLDEFHLIMLEQPLGADDLLDLAELQRLMTTPLCLDESIIDVSRARAMISLGSGRIINIKPGRVGGFSASKAIHDVCQAAGVPVWCGGMLESGIGRAYNVALASLPNFSLPGDLSPSARYWARDVVTPEWTMDHDGMVHVPRKSPGLGVEVDADFIEALTTRIEVLSSGRLAMATS